MILQAIIAQIKTGSILQVITRGNYQVYPSGKNSNELLTPYVIVFDDYAVDAYYPTDNTIRPIMIDAHFPAGFINELNAYIENEIITLLHRKRLTDSEGYVFQVYATSNLGIMQEPNDDRTISGGNDDGTISRFRRFFVPRRGL